MKYLKYLLLIWIVILLPSCVKEVNLRHSEFKGAAISSGIMYMAIYHNDTLLADSIMDGATMFYIKNGERNYDFIIDGLFDIGEDSLTLIPAKRKYMYLDSNVFVGLGAKEVCNLISAKSFAIKVHHWYLEFKNGDIDTLYLVSKNVSDGEGLLYPCQCYNPVVTFQYNGVDVELDYNYKGTGIPIYVVDKK